MRRFARHAMIAALLASPVLLHLSSALKWPTWIAALCIALQMTAMFAVLLNGWTSPAKSIALTGAGALTALLAWQFGARGLLISAGLPHAAAHSALAAMFLLSLRKGRNPLITSFMRRIRGALTAELEAYGRGVTVAWVCFFAAQLILSALLFAFAPLKVWSFFINVVSLPSVLLMFAGEYLFRRLRFRHLTHSKIRDMVGAFATWRTGAMPVAAAPPARPGERPPVAEL